MHISSSYAKILGVKLFRTWEIPRSGSKAKNGEERKRERKRERLNDGNNNGQATHGAQKPPGPKCDFSVNYTSQNKFHFTTIILNISNMIETIFQSTKFH